MSSPEDAYRKAWWVPDELREAIHGDVVDAYLGRYDVSARGRVTREGYEVSWDGHGRLFVRWGDEPHAPRSWLMIEGRSNWRSFSERLELMEAAGRETRELKLEVDVPPNVEFEFDDADLEAMAHGLARGYGHMIRVKLSRQGEVAGG